jgi:hypothetical protein
MTVALLRRTGERARSPEPGMLSFSRQSKLHPHPTCFAVFAHRINELQRSYCLKNPIFNAHLLLLVALAHSTGKVPGG